MPVTHFPDPKYAGPEGIVAVGGDLEPETLLLAYKKGIFPWPVQDEEGMVLAWFSPNPRAILEFDELHLPRSLEAARRKSRFRLSRNEAFADVIRACAETPRPHQPGTQGGTWITEEMIQAYIEFHRKGFAESVEVWDGSELVGGIYGVRIGRVAAGESMFYRKPNASKLALLHWVGFLKTCEIAWIDIQMLTPHLKALGAKEISRDDFLKRLKRVQE